MNTKMSSILVFFLLGISITLSSSGKSKAMAEVSADSPAPSPAASASVYIVLTESPSSNVEPESFHLRTLSAVLGSEEAAKKALIHVYKYALSGFSALLTPDQASILKKQPGVLEVIPDQKAQLLNAGIGYGIEILN